MTRKKKLSLFIGIVIFVILALSSLNVGKIGDFLLTVTSKNSIKYQAIEKQNYQNTEQVLQEKKQIKAKIKEYEDRHIEGMKILSQEFKNNNKKLADIQAAKSIEDINYILTDLEEQNWGNTDDDRFNEAVRELKENAKDAYNYKLTFLEYSEVWTNNGSAKQYFKLLRLGNEMADYWEYFIKKTKIYLEYPDS